MPQKVDIVRKPKKYKVTNWSQYNTTLKQRGGLEIWISADIEEMWYEEDRINDGTGVPKRYTDRAVEVAYQLKLCFNQPLRQAEEFVNSLFRMRGLSIRCPDYTTLSRRCSLLQLKVKSKNLHQKKKHESEDTIIALDTTGLKQYGKDEWHHTKHGANPKRTWRKVHVAVDNNNVLQAISLTDKATHDAEEVPELLKQIEDPADRYVGDGAYDTKEVYDTIAKHNKNAKIVIPPRENAVAGEDWHYERNKSLDIIKERCRGAWSKMRKYGMQSKAELAILRYKKIIGNKMHSRELSKQKNEVIIAASILNKFTQMGILLLYLSGKPKVGTTRDRGYAITNGIRLRL